MKISTQRHVQVAAGSSVSGQGGRCRKGNREMLGSQKASIISLSGEKQ